MKALIPLCQVALTMLKVGLFCAIPLMFQATQAAELQHTNPPATTSVGGPHVNPLFYTVNFPGGSVADFAAFWRTNVNENDNFIIIERVRNVHIPPFNVRSARLAELARSIEFLSEGRLAVVVVEKDFQNSANLWRIGGAAASGVVPLKMRAVAAPLIFHSNQVPSILETAERLDQERREQMMILLDQRGLHGALDAPCKVTALKGQMVFVVVGSEESVAGIESFIQAAEQAVGK